MEKQKTEIDKGKILKESELKEKSKPKVIAGVVSGCEKLNIRKEPNATAEVARIVDKGAELVINVDESTKEWLAVSTATGLSGFCMSKYVTMVTQ